MESRLFGDLVQSLKEAGQIARDEIASPRRTVVNSLDVKTVRERTGLSQGEFANPIRVSVKTLQNWEQNRRHPTGPASALLKIVASAPDVALRSLHP